MVTGNNRMRWQRLTDGYRRYWYSKAALRWIALISAVVNLIVSVRPGLIVLDKESLR